MSMKIHSSRGGNPLRIIFSHSERYAARRFQRHPWRSVRTINFPQRRRMSPSIRETTSVSSGERVYYRSGRKSDRCRCRDAKRQAPPVAKTWTTVKATSSVRKINVQFLKRPGDGERVLSAEIQAAVTYFNAGSARKPSDNRRTRRTSTQSTSKIQ